MKIRFLKKKFIVLLSTVQIKLTNCGTDQQKRFICYIDKYDHEENYSR